MKPTVLLLALLFIHIVMFGQPATAKPSDKWDLRKCVEYALEHNISIRQQDIQAQIAKLTYEQSNNSKYPSLNFSTNLGLNTGRSIDRTTNQFTTESVFYNSFSLQSNVDVFNWFSKKNTIEGNRLESLAASAGVDKLKNDISLNVAAAFLQTLLAKEQVNISKIQISQTTTQLENTRKQVKAGGLPELNQLQLESQLATDSFTYISAVGSETQALILMKSILNIDADAPFDIAAPPINLIPVDPIAELQPDVVYALAIKNLPQQRVNQLKLDAARKFAAAAKGQLYPSIGAGANFGTNYSNIKNNRKLLSSVPAGVDTIAAVSGTNQPVVVPVFNYNFIANPYGTQLSDNLSNGIGINITVPIFNGKSARINWQKQKLLVQNLSLQSDLDNMNLKNDIYKAYTDAVTAMQKFNSSKKAMETALKAYDFAVKRYNVGLSNILDMIISQNTLFRATIDNLSAQYEYVFKMKVLEFYKGEGIKL